MFKKFFKSIGKGIKKLGKEIGKPFKKLFKSKVGKVLGTIGLMLVAPWMAQTVGSWFSGAVATTSTATGGAVVGSTAGTVGTIGNTGISAATAGSSSAASSAAASKTFGNAMGNFFRNIGSKVKTTFNNITDGIKNIFTQGNTTTVENTVTKMGENVTTTMEGAGYNSGDFIHTTKTTGTTGTAGTAKSLETTAFETTTGKTGIVGEEAASGKVITGGEVGEVTKIKDSSSLLDKSLLEDKSFLELDKVGMQDTLTKDVTATLTEQATTGPLKRIGSRVGDVFYDVTGFDPAQAESFKSFKDATYGAKPLKNVKALPKLVRNTTVGEGVFLGQTIAANRMPEPYQAPSVDVSGAFEALSQVDTSGIGLETIGTNVPSMSALAANGMNASLADKWMNMTKKHNYIYDASQWG